jgi:hypothetical protein
MLTSRDRPCGEIYSFRGDRDLHTVIRPSERVKSWDNDEGSHAPAHGVPIDAEGGNFLRRNRVRVTIETGFRYAKP